jgi:glycogen debranching enzyme
MMASLPAWVTDDQRAAMIGHYRRIRAKTTFGVASHDPDQPNFDSMRYWRGPVWAFMNMMIGKGLPRPGLS